MRSAILKQSPCRTGRRKYREMGQTSAAVRSTPVPQRNTPGKQVSQAVRTVMGAEAILKSRVPEIVDAVQDGELSFTPDSNQSQIRRANGTLRTKGWAKALADWTADVREGKCGDEQVALGGGPSESGRQQQSQWNGVSGHSLRLRDHDAQRR